MDPSNSLSSNKRKAIHLELNKSEAPTSFKRKTSNLDPGTPEYPPPYPQHLEQDMSQGYCQQNRASSILALDYYNKKHDTNYEIVEHNCLVGNYFANHLGFWTHCSFYAKNSNNSSINQFFAEIHMSCLSEPAVSCMILEEGNTSVGCQYCRCLFIIHPVGGYQAGSISDHDQEPMDPHAGSILDHDHEPCMDPYLDEEIVEKTVTDAAQGSPSFHQSDHEYYVGIEEYREQTLTYANVALDEYNKKNHTKFELANDMPMESNAIFDGQLWIHCFFNATKGSLSKQFFAEVRFEYPATIVACVMLDGETSEGCDYCSTFLHPLDGYRAGLPTHCPPASYAISDDIKPFEEEKNSTSEECPSSYEDEMIMNRMM